MVEGNSFFKFKEIFVLTMLQYLPRYNFVEMHFRRVLQGIKYRHETKIRIKANQKLSKTKIRDI